LVGACKCRITGHQLCVSFGPKWNELLAIPITNFICIHKTKESYKSALRVCCLRRPRACFGLVLAPYNPWVSRLRGRASETQHAIFVFINMNVVGENALGA